ncbi:MAG: transporter ATP-binding protein [Peptococcaceae bacterium]|jgi:branched-chain amino acid transport system ATP-binding protein|uniref:ATP-binding cassette domain-containing protein n=1 Tax=Thermanaerosceptrum fracticalcis TaxID=1712410 RepID=A0A7G6E1V7_THEFR|nr:ABC transporter ATP-binding protein [Thermanaerosceptrum fracticalcis]MBZ4653065.1 transporter ATP-binding protein [Peptococcaceae bacterium]QNB46061.1 ATP-binding cassette domain-containing protein [Thermanaerosceptrum fracticalcis]
MTEVTNILEVRGVSKRFGGLQALDDITIGVKPQTVHGIIGPNGAGKTTLFNVITGLIQPDQGGLYLEGRRIDSLKPYQLVPRGVARTFQNIRLFKEMSVIENVLIGQHVHTPTPIFSIMINGKKSRYWEEVALQEAMDALRFVGLETKADEQVKNLSYGQQRLVEFARALAAKPKLILLDEPAAGMNPTEKANLLRLVSLLQEKGYTIVLIEHDMKLVMNICETISVLDHGKKIAEGRPEHIRKHPDVISAYLGKGDLVHAGS